MICVVKGYREIYPSLRIKCSDLQLTVTQNQPSENFSNNCAISVHTDIFVVSKNGFSLHMFGGIQLDIQNDSSDDKSVLTAKTERGIGAEFSAEMAIELAFNDMVYHMIERIKEEVAFLNIFGSNGRPFRFPKCYYSRDRFITKFRFS